MGNSTSISLTLTPEEQATLAAQLIHSDSAKGIFHLAVALESDPYNPKWLRLLEQYIASTDNPLELLPVEDDGSMYFGLAAVEAYMLCRLGRVIDGVERLLAALSSGECVASGKVWSPPYMGWLIDWLTRNPAAGSAVDRRIVVEFFAVLSRMHPGTILSQEEGRDLSEALLVAEYLIGDPDPAPMASYCRAVLLRKAGRLEESLRIAQRAFAANQTDFLANSIAQVYEANGDVDTWLLWMLTALELDPDNFSVYLDIGDKFMELKRYEEAMGNYEQALLLDRDNSWAMPSLIAADYLNGNENALQALKEYSEAFPDNERAYSLLRIAAVAYVDFLPKPGEAIIGIHQQFADMEQPPRNQVISVMLSSLEAPSAVLAARSGLLGLNLGLELDLDINAIQVPDPRLPKRNVKYAIWRYEQEQTREGFALTTEAVPAVPQPSRKVAEAVADIARSHFVRTKWYDAAAELVRRLNPSEMDLLGLMCFPPEQDCSKLPDSTGPQDISIWILKVQVVAALCLANLDKNVPWKASKRKHILLDLLAGPMDWTINAAVIALTELAQRDHSIINDLIPIFFELLNERPRPGYVCYEHTLLSCFLQFEGLPEDLRQMLTECRGYLDSSAGIPV